MNKPFLIFLVVVLIAAGLLFFDQVLGIFQGMTVLEAMQQIMSFVLHVLWVTILGFVVTVLSKIALPWVRVFLRKQKRTNRPGQAGREPVHSKKIQLSRGNKDQALMYLIQQMAKSVQRPPSPPAPLPKGDGSDRIKLDF